MLVTAHRGSSGSAPENTLAALQQAILDQADMAEVDVQATADGELVLFHDQDLTRTAADSRCLWQLTYAQISQLDGGSWFGAQFAGEPIPRLSDALALAAGRLRLNLEIKSYSPEPASKDYLVYRVAQQVQTCGFADRCVLTSFDRGLLRRLRQQAPHLKLGLIRETPPETVEDWVDLYSLRASCAAPELIRGLQAQNKAVHLWTVNDPEQMRQLIAWGADSLITDFPLRLRQVMAALD